ncbi:unnamed protein product [Rhizophagus irregularis]|nr:unnamed protein product [Rhizophagus irregularis]
MWRGCTTKSSKSLWSVIRLYNSNKLSIDLFTLNITKFDNVDLSNEKPNPKIENRMQRNTTLSTVVGILNNENILISHQL